MSNPFIGAVIATHKVEPDDPDYEIAEVAFCEKVVVPGQQVTYKQVRSPIFAIRAKGGSKKYWNGPSGTLFKAASRLKRVAKKIRQTGIAAAGVTEQSLDATINEVKRSEVATKAERAHISALMNAAVVRVVVSPKSTLAPPAAAKAAIPTPGKKR